MARWESGSCNWIQMARPQIGQGVVVDVPATTANLGPGFDCLGAAVDLNNRFELRCLEGGSERFDLIIEGILLLCLMLDLLSI